MNDEQRQYPHEVDSEHTPTPRDVYEHYVANPDMYHPGLDPHMDRFFEKNLKTEKSVGVVAVNNDIRAPTPRDLFEPINQARQAERNFDAAYRELHYGSPSIEQVKLLVDKGFTKDIVAYGVIAMSEADFVDYLDETGRVDELLDMRMIYNNGLLSALIRKGYGEPVIDRCIKQNVLPEEVVLAIGDAGLIDMFTAKYESASSVLPLENIIQAYEQWHKPEYITDNAEQLVASASSHDSYGIKQLLTKLVNTGEADRVKEIATGLVENNGPNASIQPDILLALGMDKLIIDNLEKFSHMSQHVTRKLYSKYPDELVAFYRNAEVRVSDDMMRTFIDDGRTDIIAAQLKYAYNLEYGSKIATMLIKDGYVEAVANYLGKFYQVDATVADALIENNIQIVCQNLSSIDHVWFAQPGVLERLIPHVQPGDIVWLVGSAWDSIESPSKELIEYVIERTGANFDVMRAIIFSLHKAVGLDAHTAEMLIKNKSAFIVAENLEHFNGMNVDILTEMAINYGAINVQFLAVLSKFEYEDESLLQNAVDIIMNDPSERVRLLSYSEDRLEKYNIDKVALFEQAFKDNPVETLKTLAQRYDDVFKRYLKPEHLYVALKDGFYKKTHPWQRSDAFRMFGEINGDELIAALRSVDRHPTNGWIMNELSQIENITLSHDSYSELVGDIETAGITLVLGMLRTCDVKGLDRQAIFEQIKDSVPQHIIGTYLHAFRGCSLPAELAYNLVEDFPYDVFGNIEQFEGVDHTRIALGAIEAERSYLVIDCLEKFRGLKPEVVDALIKEDCSVNLIIQNIDSFDGVYEADMADLAVGAGQYTAIVESDQLQREVVANMRSRGVIPYCEKSIAGLSSEQYAAFIQLLKKLPAQDRPETIMKVGELMGSFANGQVAVDLRELTEKNHITKSFEKMGITQTGPEGVRQVESIARRFINEIHSADISEDTERLLAESELMRRIFSSATRYDSSQWGDRSDESLERLLKHRRVALERDELAPMPEEYSPSKIYDIETIDADKEKVVWTEDTISRYRVLRDDLNDVTREGSLSGKKFTNKLQDLRAKVRLQIEAMQQEIVDPVVSENQQFNDEAARQKYIENKTNNLIRRSNQLEAWLEEVEGSSANGGRRFVLNSPEAFEAAFKNLEPYKDLHADMRKIVFGWAVRKNPHLLEEIAELPEDPDVESISRVRDFIDHIVNNSAYKEYFTDKKAANKFKQMSSTRALEDALSRNQELAQKTSTRAVQFMPTRGFMLEVSGHMADACWATQYDSIAKERPNMSAVVIKDQPGTDREKIVGSALLIESTVAETGQPVLILRGNNPIENWINKRSVDSYFSAMTDYVKETAKKRGMIAAVVIDDHSGGSCSNRPALFEYCRNMALGAKGGQKLEKVIVNGNDTNFNGYDIRTSTYLIPA